MKRQILIVDDDINFLDSLKNNLENKGYIVTAISNSSIAEKKIITQKYSCILLDIKMPGLNGIDLLKICFENNPFTPVLIVSGQSNIEIAVEAIKLGAFDFIEKPIDIEKLHIAIKNAVNKNILTLEKENLLHELKTQHKIISISESMNSVMEQIKTFADTPAKVLIQGETGTGKELVAWALHYNSSRKSEAYIKINCAAIPSELLESELFGHHKGSFTGASSNKYGKFIAADGGTLFLDEIGDMSMELQAKILRVLENNEVDIIGTNKPRKINVRVIAATNKNLEERIKNGLFRADLYYRLNVMNIYIPPLRFRKDDILPLTYHFIKIFNQVYNKSISSIDKSTEDILLNYDWKGNVRELKNIIEKVVIYCKGNSIGLMEIQKAMYNIEEINYIDYTETLNLKEAKNNFEKKYITNSLLRNNWKISKTAEKLGIDRTNLFKKIKKLGIEKE